MHLCLAASAHMLCKSWLAANGTFSSHNLLRAVHVSEVGTVHELAWVPAAQAPACKWREDAVGSIAHGQLPMPPTLFFGESNDNLVLNNLCMKCNVTVLSFMPNLTSHDNLACNCSGWLVASFLHPGVANDPPFWLSLENPRTDRYRPGVPLSHAASIPFVAKLFRAFWGVRAQVVIAHSGSWDSARACQNERRRPITDNLTDAFVHEWSRNATEVIGELREHFPQVLWRAPNPLAPSTSPRQCSQKSGGSIGVCRAGGRMYACNEVWRFHNHLLEATVALMDQLHVPLLRWDEFVKVAGDTGQQIHPPVSFHAAFANLIANIVLSDSESQPKSVRSVS